MGFGMQSWVYKRRPRKAFSKRDRMNAFVPLNENSRVFKLKPNVKENKIVLGSITIISALLLSLLLVISVNKLKKFSAIHSIELKEIRSQKKMETFNFLMDSGIYRLKHNNIQGAYSEFKLAQNIYPDGKELNQLLIETTSILCEKDIKYCNELDGLLETN